VLLLLVRLLLRLVLPQPSEHRCLHGSLPLLLRPQQHLRRRVLQVSVTAAQLRQLPAHRLVLVPAVLPAAGRAAAL
jgi:hypothetical protein